jgi:hypothetical protein
MDSYYYNNSAFYNCNQSPYLAQVNTNSVPEGYNYNFNASRNDTLSSPYQYGYNGYNHQSLSPYIYNENDSAYCSSSDYSNYSLNGTYYNHHVFAANSPSNYTEPSIKKRVREDDSTSPTITIESRAEQSKKRAKVVKLGESDLNIHKLISGRGDNHYICSICSIPFESKAKLLMHEHKYHNGGSSKQCPICRKLNNSLYFLIFSHFNILPNTSQRIRKSSKHFGPFESTYPRKDVQMQSMSFVLLRFVNIKKAFANSYW